MRWQKLLMASCLCWGQHVAAKIKYGSCLSARICAGGSDAAEGHHQGAQTTTELHPSQVRPASILLFDSEISYWRLLCLI